MRRLLKASALLLCLSYAGAIYGQSLIVTAVSHSTRDTRLHDKHYSAVEHELHNIRHID